MSDEDDAVDDGVDAERAAGEPSLLIHINSLLVINSLLTLPGMNSALTLLGMKGSLLTLLGINSVLTLLLFTPE